MYICSMHACVHDICMHGNYRWYIIFFYVVYNIYILKNKKYKIYYYYGFGMSTPSSNNATCAALATATVFDVPQPPTNLFPPINTAARYAS